MKKFLILTVLGAAALPAFAEFATPGIGTAFSLSDLAADDASGIVALDGDFYITSDLTIAPGDSLMVNEATHLSILAAATLSIQGYLEMDAPDTIHVSNYVEESEFPRSIMIDGGRAVFNKVAFSGVGVHNWSEQPLTLTGCSFTGVTAASNSTGAVAIGKSNSGNVISGCVFSANAVPAIGTSANAFCGMTVTDCILSDNNTDNSNKPQINITTPAENGPTVISNNIITGAQRNMVGGIAVANMLGGEMGDVEISSNTITDHRYGINIFGPMRTVIKDNKLIDNRYESNPMNGGSGISCTAFDGKESVVVSGNHIEGSLWGVTLISYGFLMPSYYPDGGFAYVSLGGPADSSYPSPGENVFVANGNNGSAYDPTVPYDLYNNTDQTVYAQNNTWSVSEQSEELVATVIFDKADDARLGEVIYMPTHAGISAVAADTAPLSYDAATRTIIADGPVSIYTIDGRLMLCGSGAVSTAPLPSGLYIAVNPSASLRFSR